MVVEKLKLDFNQIDDLIDKIYEYISKNMDKSNCIALIGDLGTGKTYFSKRLLKKLGVNEAVKSPTFTYLIEYELENFDIYHFDVYRLKTEQDLYNIGYYDYIDLPNSLILIEWANNILEYLPENTIYFEIEHLSENSRIVSLYETKEGKKVYVNICDINNNK